MMNSSDATLMSVIPNWNFPLSAVPRTFSHVSAAITVAVRSCRGQNASTSTFSPGCSDCRSTSWNDSVNIVASAAMLAARMIQKSTQPQRNPAQRPYPSRRYT